MASIAVVGGGFGGVGAVTMLARAGHHDWTVFERSERVGGVWNDNTYPGAACDVPSHLYEFSFAPNPRWSRRYAPQPEIERTVWHTGCTNWYVDERGNDPNQWPWLWSQYRRRTDHLEPAAYALG
jgi:cation diffusion facilitator CzcD-associated flavoprotein CzcO